jgi:hypothetical protein
MSDLPTQNNFILYQTPNGEVSVTVLLQDETIWLTQEQTSQLFDRERSVITKHIRNVFSEGELEEKSNVQNLHISGSDKPVKFYNLAYFRSIFTNYLNNYKFNDILFAEENIEPLV